MTKRQRLGSSAQLLTRPTEPSTTKTGLVAALQSTGDRGGLLTLRLDQIATNPDNPRSVMGDLEGLAGSIRDLGVLSPVLVVPVDVFLAENPHHRGAIEAEEYVLAAGHRRVAAARLAGIHEVPAMVKPQLDKIDGYITFVDENMHRAGLGPLEEAQAYQLLIDAGLTQSAAATRLRVSQGQVSKRLSLLRLAQPLQDALSQGQVSTNDALLLTGLSPSDQAEVWQLAHESQLPMTTALTRHERHKADREAIASAEAQAEAEGVATVADPHETWGSGYYFRRLDTKAQITKARKAGELRAHPTPRGLVYYTAADDQPTQSPHEVATKAEAKAKREANKARTAAAGQLALTCPPEAEALTTVLANMLTGGVPYGDALRLTHRWLGSTLGEHTDDPYAWARSLTTAPRATQLHAAWALTLAAQEIGARWSHGPWSTKTRDYLHQLQAHGYQPTPWEAERLTHITEDHS